jgi:hypothetical protein
MLGLGLVGSRAERWTWIVIHKSKVALVYVVKRVLDTILSVDLGMI